MRPLKIAIASALIGAGVYALVSNPPDTPNGSAARSQKDEVARIRLETSFPISQDIAELLKKEADFNDKCRDGIGNDPNKMEFCIKRDAVFDELTSKGWCWGKEGQAEYQMEWHPCEAPNRIQTQQAQTAPVESSSSDPVIETRATDPLGQYSFSFSAAGGFHPSINGTTNAQDGTILLINILKPWLPDGATRLARGMAACGNDCFPAIDPAGNYGAKITVKAGRFSTDPFSFAGAMFIPGVYPIQVFILPDVFGPTPLTQNDMANLKRPILVSRLVVSDDGTLRFAPGCPPELLNSCSISNVSRTDQTQQKRAIPSFDCKDAKTTAEISVCTNTNLAVLDSQVADLYRKVLSSVSDSNEMIGEQRNWLRQRDACSSVECLTVAYQNRLSDLKRWIGTQNR